MMKKSLLFVPDISGFTNFVSETEIKHSRHIVADLLELIIDSDELDLEVSEVEGDAVLFFKYQDVPSLEKVYEQAEKTFVDFHRYLEQYEYERICRCGACSSAINLSLKFVAHSGEIEKIKIKNHHKLHGKDVILVHRLLKNDVKANEYLLWTKQSLDGILNFELGADFSNYENYGDVNYNFISFSKSTNLKQKKIDLPSHEGNHKVVLNETFNLEMPVLYELITDFQKRLKWSKRVQDILTKEDEELLKSGNFHTCVIGDNKLNIESVGRFESKDELIYAERLNDFKIFKVVLTNYIFRKRGKQTELTIENSFQLKKKWMSVLASIFKKQFLKSIHETYRELKDYEQKISS